MKLIDKLLATRAAPQTPAAIVETVLLPVLAIALGLWLAPADPLLAHAQFPWIWLAPVLLALRYGTASGIAGAAVLAAGWYLLAHYGLLQAGRS
ncbi:MAG: hypothetical protein HGA47_16000, partial [Zoogloea sp.]|nr:hypothetical protein [Zoogloea sp.]